MASHHSFQKKKNERFEESWPFFLLFGTHNFIKSVSFRLFGEDISFSWNKFCCTKFTKKEKIILLQGKGRFAFQEELQLIEELKKKEF